MTTMATPQQIWNTMPGWGIVADLTPPELIATRRLRLLRKLLAAGLSVLLVLLVAATLALAYAPMGRFNLPVALGIAAAKAVLIAVFFMNLRRPDPLLRLAGGASLLWIS